MGASMRKVEFYRHNIGDEEIQNVTDVLRTLFLTTGDTVRQFEESFSRYLGCECAVGVTSCTAGLHLSLLAYDIGPGDEVITTPMSFVATAHAIVHVGARPVFVDVEPTTGNMNPDLIEAALTPKTKAILPVHLAGQMCDVKRIRELGNRHGLRVIEDAAHALEAQRDGARPAQLTDAACFSFYATKSITSGEGGAIVTNNPSVANKLRQLRLHGMDLSAGDRYTKRFQHYDVEYCGWKYNMDNIQAALLMPQLRRVEEYRDRRNAICDRYRSAFSRAKDIGGPEIPYGSRSAHHLFTIWVDPNRRDEILLELQNQGVGVAVNFRPIHLLSFYRRTFGFREGMFPVAEGIGRRTISLPLYPQLTDAEVDWVAETVLRVVGSA
jgi:dTDP-4-amino-4,6-dideoxygalactose transaminase